MAALDRRYARYSLLCTSLAAPLCLAAGDHPYQQWVCRPAASGGWECRDEQATPGVYPQAERPKAPATAPTPLATEDKPAPKQAKQSATVAATAAEQWDWVPAEQLPPELRCQLGPGCDGAYVEPPRDWPDADKPRDDAPLRASSATSEWQGETVTVEGNVVVTKGELKLTADRGRINRSEQKADLEGHVTLREPGLLMAGERAHINSDTGLGDLEQARILHYDSGARATAARLSRVSEQVAVLEDARYTQCMPGDEVWSLSASNIRLDNNTGRGESKHTVLRLGPVPVFYSPYLNFPIDDRRQSGWLWPSLSSSDGGDISAPYYLNLAPNYDATLTPRFIGDRGAMLETELRHLSSYGKTQLAGAYLPDDDITGEDRWLFSGQHDNRFGKHVGTWVDYSKVSDIDYFRDLSVSSLEIKRQTHLNQAGRLDLRGGNWTSQLLAQEYQTIDEFVAEPYKRLPQWTVRRSASDINFRPDYTFLSQYTDFDHDESIENGGTRVTGQRLYSELGLTLPMYWAAGYIQPTVRMRYVGYELDDLPTNPNSRLTDDNPSAAAPLAIIDAGLFFERDGDNYSQTLEPRLFYLWSEHEDQADQPLFDTSRMTFSYQQLFRSSRFTGYDRLEDFDQLSVGLTHRWISKESGRELITASVGQIFYFDDREVDPQGNNLDPALNPILWNSIDTDNRRSNSEMAAELRVQPSDQFWATASTLWDTVDDKVNEGGFYLHYAGDNRHLFNLGYRYRRARPGINRLTRDLEQADFSAAIPLGDRWSLYTRFNYDIEDGRSLEDLFGVQYEDCCWMTRVVYQRAVEGEEVLLNGDTRLARDHAIIFEFQLKGLGSLGSKAGGLLEESILGYRESE